MGTTRVIAFGFAVVVAITAARSGHAEILAPQRRIDWQPGVPGGIPEIPVQHDVVASFGAMGDGVADDTDAIRAAIAATSPGDAVFLPPGTYRLTEPIGLADGVVVRGAGPTETFVVQQHGGSAFVMKGEGPTASTTVAAPAAKGDTTIVVGDASGFAVDDIVRWSRLGDEVQQMGRVVAIAAQELTLERPLYSDLPAGSAIDRYDVIRDAGIEDMHILTDWPEADGYTGTRKVDIYAATRCWVDNVETYGYSGHEAMVLDCYQCEVRDSYFHQSLELALAQPSFFIYGVELSNGTTDTLVENNIFDFYRHAMVIQRDISGGNVFGYNMSWNNYTKGSDGTTVRAIIGDLELHHEQVEYTLFEGNHAEHARVAWSEGYEHVYNTFLRNRITQSGITAKRFSNVIGNELPAWKYEIVSDNWFPRNDIRIEEDTIAHGNYVTEGDEGLTWDPAIADHEIPASYYRSSRPAWFCDLDWPPFGGDLMPGNQRRSPAEVRFWSIKFPEASPSELVLTTLDATSVRLDWTHASDNEVDFVVVRSADGEGFARVGTTTETTWVDAELDPAATYRYYVRARNHLGGEHGDELGGESSPSNLVSTDPLDDLQGIEPCQGAGAPPGGDDGGTGSDDGGDDGGSNDDGGSSSADGGSSSAGSTTGTPDADADGTASGCGCSSRGTPARSWTLFALLAGAIAGRRRLQTRRR